MHYRGHVGRSCVPPRAASGPQLLLPASPRLPHLLYICIERESERERERERARERARERERERESESERERERERERELYI
jgi:hypothetical protein